MTFDDNSTLDPGSTSTASDKSKISQLETKIEALQQTVTSVADSVSALSNNVNTQTLTAHTATVTTQTTGTENVTTLNATSGDVDNLTSACADITSLSADSVEADTIDANTVNADIVANSVNAQSYTGVDQHITGTATVDTEVTTPKVTADEVEADTATLGTVEVTGTTIVRGDVNFPETGDEISGQYLAVKAENLQASSLATEEHVTSSKIVGYDENGKLIPIDAVEKVNISSEENNQLTEKTDGLYVDQHNTTVSFDEGSGEGSAGLFNDGATFKGQVHNSIRTSKVETTASTFELSSNSINGAESKISGSVKDDEATIEILRSGDEPGTIEIQTKCTPTAAEAGIKLNDEVPDIDMYTESPEGDGRINIRHLHTWDTTKNSGVTVEDGAVNLYASSVTANNNKILTTADVATTVESGNTKPVTSGAVNDALTNYVNKFDTISSGNSSTYQHYKIRLIYAYSGASIIFFGRLGVCVLVNITSGDGSLVENLFANHLTEASSSFKSATLISWKNCGNNEIDFYIKTAGYNGSVRSFSNLSPMNATITYVEEVSTLPEDVTSVTVGSY